MDQVICKTVKAIVENSGAQRGTLFMLDEETGQLVVSAEYNATTSEIQEKRENETEINRGRAYGERSNERKK